MGEHEPSSAPVVIVSNDTHVGPRLVEDLWGSDYPHLEGTFVNPEGRDTPSVTRLALRHTFCNVPAEEIRRMVGQNAIDVYGLDAGALQAVADEIGAPTLDELATPIDAVPASGSITAFRSGAGGWG